MELLPLVCLCLLTCSGTTFADEPLIIKVREGSDVTLPCSFITTKDIRAESFDWRKDGEKDVFVYDGSPSSGQDPQFKGRVSLSDKELKNGDASITIKNTKVTDTGDYTCFFPSIRLTRHMKLRVEPVIIRVTDGSDVTLPCFFKLNIERESIEWKKDDQKLVFTYESGFHSNNHPSGQHRQFRGRASHCKDELQSGKASITIGNAQMADSGIYTCEIQRLNVKHHIKLVVVSGSATGRTVGPVLSAVLAAVVLFVL